MTYRYFVDLHATKRLDKVGAKVHGLRWLIDQGASVPAAYVCPFDVQAIFEGQDEPALAKWQHELRQVIRRDRRYAVRSAANLEDGGDASFAGQFLSTLDVTGGRQVRAAVEQTFASLSAPGLLAYMAKIGVDRRSLMMSIIIQEMVTPVVSGVAFSRNPITGHDEVIVEAVRGSGTALVQDGLTPLRWVHKWGDWTSVPPSSELDTSFMDSVVAETRRLARRYGRAIDLEWVFDGENVQWLQVRPITRLDNINIYSNRISREVLPGIIKPLVWSVNIPTVNGAWTDLFAELIGPHDIDPNALARPFHHRAYFNMGVIGEVFTALGLPAETLELLMGLEGGDEKPRFKPDRRIVRHLPRLLRFMVDKLRFARKVSAFLPAIEAKYRSFANVDVGALDDSQLQADVARLTGLYRQIAYFNIVTPLLAMAYDAVFRRQLARKGVEPEQFDLMAGLVALQKYDPVPHLAALRQAYDALDEQRRTAVAASDYEAFKRLPGLAPFQAAVANFIAQFGHLSDSGNDLSATPWREDGDLVLKLITAFTDGRGVVEKVRFDDLVLRPWERVTVGGAYRRAREFRFLREAVSSTYTYGYGLFRVYFLEIGRRLVARGILEGIEDVFYLHQDELLAALAGREATDHCRAMVDERRSAIERTGALTLPGTIYGDVPPPEETFDRTGNRLSGLPTSRGYFQGPARIITGVRAFDRLQAGDVLVIPYSDVAWTPLFARAGAIVAEAGGVLSHSSIVAREYNIPAVVSVEGACQIPDGQLVTVDGTNGAVWLHPD